jgi:hypothetical protein
MGQPARKGTDGTSTEEGAAESGVGGAQERTHLEKRVEGAGEAWLEEAQRPSEWAGEVRACLAAFSSVASGASSRPRGEGAGEAVTGPPGVRSMSSSRSHASAEPTLPRGLPRGEGLSGPVGTSITGGRRAAGAAGGGSRGCSFGSIGEGGREGSSFGLELRSFGGLSGKASGEFCATSLEPLE